MRKLFRKIISFVLVAAMIFTTSSFSLTGQMIARAEVPSCKLYFELPSDTQVTDWAVNVWGNISEITGDYDHAFRPDTWGDGDKYPTLLADGNLTGWGYVEIGGSIEGLQFVKADGTEYKCWNSQIAARGISVAYFDPDTFKWYTEPEKINEIKEAEIRNIFVVAGDDGLTGKHWSISTANNPGLMTVSSLNPNIFSVTFKNVEAGTYEYKILQDPDNKGWDLPFGDNNNRRITVPYKANVTLSIDITDANKNVNASFEKTEETGNITDLAVSDQVKLVIGNNSYNMNIYLNGVYETAVDLTSGTYNAAVTVSGSAIATDFVTVPSDSKVYFRFANKKLTDSVNSRIVHTAAFVGNFTGLEFLNDNGDTYTINTWDPSDNKGELTYIGGGLYKGTFKFKKLENDLVLADGGYKVAFDDSWDYSLGNNGSNIALTIPAGTTEITIFVDEIRGVVYDSVRNGAFSSYHYTGSVNRNSFSTTVTLAGSMNGWSGATGQGYDFTQISDTLYRYNITLNAGTYQYKVVFDGKDWFENGGNKTLEITNDNTNVVIVYNAAEDRIYDSIGDTSALSILLGMAAAPATMKVTDNKNGTTTFTATGSEGQSVVLYYAAKSDVETYGISAFTKVDLGNIVNGSASSEPVFFGDGALDILYYYEIDGIKTLDSSNAIITVGGNDYSNYKRAEFRGRVVNVPGTFPGPSWDPASNQMTYLGNGLYSYTFKNVPAGNYEFKISFTTWAENYGVGGVQDGPNYSVMVPYTQDVTVYYTDLKTHLAVTSLNYLFIDAYLEGTGVNRTKFTDDGLTGIYSAKVYLNAGTYSDVAITSEGRILERFYEFTLDKAREVTFYFAPSFDVFYNDADEFMADTNSIRYSTKDIRYKSIYGAVPTDTDVTFTIDTDNNVTAVKMLVKLNTTEAYDLVKKVNEDGSLSWSVTTQFGTIGEYEYFFVIYTGNAVKIYCDDSSSDYGTGVVTDLTAVNPYDLIVYKKDFKTPDWMKNAVIYQIFPDRFANGDSSNDRAQLTSRGAANYEFITDWDLIPENPEQESLLTREEYEKTGAYYGDGIWNNEIYGGDIKGITEHIDYLKALGVTVIYLNPVLSSISCHRYDTSDYSKIDPILGDLGDFVELVETARANGMKVVLDGVFNHVSDDSAYFDRYYKYLHSADFDGKIGAYPYWAYVYDYMNENGCSQDTAEDAAKKYFAETCGVTDFSYTTWFTIYPYSYLTDGNGNTVCDNIGDRAGKPVYGYDGWWGYDSMPVIKSTNGSEYQTTDWAEKIIGKADANGNYANNGSIAQYWLSKGASGWRLDVANEISDETWQHFRKSVKALDSDAVIIGEIWDDATKYLLGDMYDSVMNYVFRNAALSYAKGGSSKEAMAALEKLRERYPQEAFYAMMNLVGSHDTTRLLSYLDGINDDRSQKDINSAFPKYDTTSDEAKKRQYLVALLQFTYPGAPTIYYGDEIGTVGADDPDNRRTFAWGKGNKELVTYYATLANIRSQYSALRTGSITPIDTSNDSLLGYVRSDDEAVIAVIMNNSTANITYTLDTAALGLNTNVLTDILTGKSYTVNGTAVITIPALSGVILTDNVKAISVDQNALKVAYETGSSEDDQKDNPPDDSNDNPGGSPNIPVIQDTKTSISGAAVKLSKTEYIYDGEAKEPAVTVTIGGITLSEGTDYTVEYKSNREAGTAVVIITGKGAYAGTVTVNFSIKPVNIDTSAIVKLSKTIYTYNGKARKPGVTVTVGDNKLTEGTDYTVEYKSNTDAGTAKAVITGKGNYTGTIEVAYKIKPAKIEKSNTTVNLSKTVYTYDGKAKKPGVTVIFGDTTLKKGTDFTVKYKSNKAIGTAKAVISGQGNYTGTITVTFKIIPAKTKLSAKSVTKNSVSLKWDNVDGITGYQIQYSTSKNFEADSTVTKTVTGASSNSMTLKKLSKNKKYYVRIRAYKTVDGKNIYGKWTVISIKTKSR